MKTGTIYTDQLPGGSQVTAAQARKKRTKLRRILSVLTLLAVALIGYLGTGQMDWPAILSDTNEHELTGIDEGFSFIVSVVICLFLVIAGIPPVVEFLSGKLPGWPVDGFAAFSVFPHYDRFQKGLLDSRDWIFFLSAAGFCLFATGVVIRNLRSGH